MALEATHRLGRMQNAPGQPRAQCRLVVYGVLARMQEGIAVTGRGPMIFSFDDDTLDTATLELRHRDQPVSVEPKVFDILVHLIRNPNQVVTRDDLLEAV